MNYDQRPNDRPRVASFLIDDILAPQAVSSVPLCSPSQPTPEIANLRIPPIGTTTDSAFSASQPFASSCLQCYGTFIIFSVLSWFPVRNCEKFSQTFGHFLSVDRDLCISKLLSSLSPIFSYYNLLTV